LELRRIQLITLWELLNADEGGGSVFCGMNFCGFAVLRRIYFCGYEIKTIFFMLYIHIFFQIKLTIE